MRGGFSAVAVVFVPVLATAEPRFLGDEGPRTFAVPTLLKKNVRLWSRVYGEYASWQQLYYDTREMDLVLGVLDLKRYTDDPERRTSAVEAERRRIQQALLRLSRGKRRGLSPLERRLLGVYRGRLRALRGAHSRVGAHPGLRDRFLEGLVRMARYRPYVVEVLRRYGLPEELLALAMTESLFNPRAKSRAGAYGVWQFLRGTGREYLHINDVVDERRDPIVSTDAAARMLRSNLRRLRKWPLALSGYHYGPNGMARAAQETGSYDLTVILRRWRSKRFKFASRNYYASFLAALEVMRDRARYFPGARLPAPLRFATVELPASVPIQAIVRRCGVKPGILAELNLALTRGVLSSRVRLPQGFPLRVPEAAGSRCQERFRRSVNPRGKARVRKHRVKPGESFVELARRYGTTVSRILSLNGLDAPRHLRVGEALLVPGRGGRFSFVPVKPARVAKANGSGTEEETRPD
jgi:membrane-bound lytic murein transglycosylase D